MTPFADPATRDRILDTAGRLFYARGIRGVGLAEIIAAAGCGKNVLYRYFPGKDELVRAYLERFAERLGPEMDAAVAGLERAPAAALVAVARHVADQVAAPDFRGCPFRNYLREMRDLSGSSGRLALAEVRRLRDRVDALVAELGTDDPEVLAERIWLVLEGAYASAPYGDREKAASTAVGLVQDLLTAA
ncbi:TetR/AcrR family transcriptional regulator [Nocardioides sp. LHG3406-4]|uniref:TetR/AcrR family transcriptional regulator n=1 Tax=Nocardioides sp. LHG3406-4 TaxID=2804575 RepID=UPI003CF7DC5F